MASNYSHKNTGQSNKRKPSSPKTNDRNSNPSTQPRSTHNHHPHRNRPRSGSSSLPTASQDQQYNNRRPSAPPSSSAYSKQPPLSVPPRLSIADRFMAPSFSLSNTTSPAPSTFTSSSALSHSARPHSGLSDVPTSSSHGRLSVADKFIDSPTSSTLNIARGVTHRHSSPIDPVPGKLSIADSFMRHTSDGNPLSRSRAQSVGEMDLGIVNKDPKLTPSSSSTSSKKITV
jgi:hypothetical protein